MGKTHICAGLGVKAIEHGFSVAYYPLEDLLHEMRKDAGVSPQRLRRQKDFNVAYLVVDEVGFEPMTREDASLFFRLVSYRYCRGMPGDAAGVRRSNMHRHPRRRAGQAVA